MPFTLLVEGVDDVVWLGEFDDPEGEGEKAGGDEEVGVCEGDGELEVVSKFWSDSEVDDAEEEDGGDDEVVGVCDGVVDASVDECSVDDCCVDEGVDKGVVDGVGVVEAWVELGVVDDCCEVELSDVGEDEAVVEESTKSDREDARDATDAVLVAEDMGAELLPPSVDVGCEEDVFADAVSEAWVVCADECSVVAESDAVGDEADWA